MKTVDISGMDPEHKQYGYEWGCQVLMCRALYWLARNEDTNARFGMFKNVAGLMIPENETAKQMEDFSVDHPKLNEFGVTGAMVQYALMHAMQRHRLGEEKYFAEFADQPDRIFDFDERDAFPAQVTS